MKFFYPNELVMTKTGPGRVVHHNYYTKMIHVMHKVGENSWKIIPHHQLYVKEHEQFLWTIGQVFRSNYPSYPQYYRYF